MIRLRRQVRMIGVSRVTAFMEVGIASQNTGVKELREDQEKGH